MIGFNKNKSKVLISKLEIKARNVKKKTAKVCKRLFNFNDSFHDFNFT